MLSLHITVAVHVLVSPSSSSSSLSLENTVGGIGKMENDRVWQHFGHDAVPFSFFCLYSVASAMKGGT
jgi:hypothetical protein